MRVLAFFRCVTIAPQTHTAAARPPQPGSARPFSADTVVNGSHVMCSRRNTFRAILFFLHQTIVLCSEKGGSNNCSTFRKSGPHNVSMFRKGGHGAAFLLPSWCLLAVLRALHLSSCRRACSQRYSALESVRTSR